ncbi:hypothetical protein GDO86_008917 [Hymenochirus boettgeri]|uniref:Protein saal1 n=1 Tax=Hymenochirus boettgeri TaxID=247094 RepID=A0A8T2J442_9PIPI|nr:hypothetical protein GDO86_008917 [Hymenochirus boettgeri]
MEKKINDSSPPDVEVSNHMDRNPSPPSSDDEEDSVGDSIGSTVYSKHWVFTTLTKLIEVISEDSSSGEQDSGDLDEDLENEICKVWDMSTNKDVALFLQEFKAPEILLGVIAKSKCSRLTEICVGILGNMACFQEPCLVISKNDDLGEVLLMLLSDTDPPTLLETSRLILTCLKQAEVSGTWADRISKAQSVRDNLCFIMTSSTNVDLLVKVGELVDELFQVDEDLMTAWIKGDSQPRESLSVTDSENNEPAALHLVPCVLEAAKQLRSDSPEGLDVYMHIMVLLGTVDEGVQAIVQCADGGKEIWNFLFDLTCSDLCQPNDPPLIVQEQKTLLSSVFSIMSMMFVSQADQNYTQIDKNLPLVGSIMRVTEHLDTLKVKNPEYCSPDGSDSDDEGDFHLQILRDICCEFLSHILSKITKENLLEGIKQGHVTKNRCLSALRHLLPVYDTSVNSLLAAIGEADRTLADTLQKEAQRLRRQS